MVDVILIYPKTGFDIGAGVTPPFSILSVAAEIQDKYEIKIIDQRTDHNWENTLKKYLNQNPLCVGISSMSGYQILFALKAAKIIRENSKIPIVWGGVHPTLLAEQTIKDKYVDLIVRREGEKTFSELLNELKKSKRNFKKIKGLTFTQNNKIIHNEDRPFIDLNTVKKTPWHLINVEDYVHSGVVVKGSKRELDIGETSRGCPYRCGFCYNNVFNKRTWRAMSAENVVKKIIYHVNKFNLDVIWLRDDEFFVDIKRVEKIAKALIKEKLEIKWYTSGIRINMFNRMSGNTIKLLEQSGCNSFRFGTESGSPRILNLIKKDITIEEILKANRNIKKYGIAPHYSFMMGFPTETIKEAFQTVNLMKKLKKENPLAHFHGMSMCTPYPGTDLFELLLKLGFKMPKSLRAWSNFHHLNNWAIHLPKSERAIMTNIADMSYFIAYAGLDAIPKSIKFVLAPSIIWLKFRWKHNLFKFTPELKLMKFARDIVMMKS